MHVHVRVEHVLETVARRNSFKCAHCMHWQRAEVRGVGAGAVLLGDRDYARERAQISAAKDGDRLLRFATCPKCGKRGHRRAFFGRYALIYGTLCALMLLLGLVFPVLDHSFDAGDAHFARTWGQLIIDGFLLLVVLPLSISEWRKLDARVRWLDFK